MWFLTSVLFQVLAHVRRFSARIRHLGEQSLRTAVNPHSEPSSVESARYELFPRISSDSSPSSTYTYPDSPLMFCREPLVENKLLLVVATTSESQLIRYG